MSTLETAIIYSVLLLFLCFLIVAPTELVFDAAYEERCGFNELLFFCSDENVITGDEVNGIDVTDTSAERLCTILTGMSDSFQIVYGGVEEAVGLG